MEDEDTISAKELPEITDTWENQNSLVRMASQSKRVTSKPEGKVDRCILKHSNYELIVSYLEDADNFAALYGSGGKTKIGGKLQTKTTAFGVMAVRLQSLGFPPCSGSKLYKKVIRYRNRYESAFSMLKQTGSGLTDEDLARGITLEEKLNKACPFFSRMDALFGTKANIVPPATCELGIPGTGGVEVISVNKDSDEEDLTCLPTSEKLGEALEEREPLKEDFVQDSQVARSTVQEQIQAPTNTSPSVVGVDLSSTAPVEHVTGTTEEPQPVKDVKNKRQPENDNPSEIPTRSVKQKVQPKLKGNLQSIIVEEMKKKEEFRKSLLEMKVALLQEQKLAAEQERMERKKAIELEQEEKRAQRKQEADSAMAAQLFSELAKSNRPVEEVKHLIEFFFQRQTMHSNLGSDRQ